MRIKECSEQVRYLREAVKDDKLETIFRGLDVLSSTPWVINKSVFDVVLEVWNGGEAIADIPPASISLQEPEKPENYDTDMRVRANHTHAIREALQQHQNNHSQRCSTNYKMEVARAVRRFRSFPPRVPRLTGLSRSSSMRNSTSLTI